MNKSQASLINDQISNIEALLATSIKASNTEGIKATVAALETIEIRYGVASELLSTLRA